MTLIEILRIAAGPDGASFDPDQVHKASRKLGMTDEQTVYTVVAASERGEVKLEWGGVVVVPAQCLHANPVKLERKAKAR